MNKKKNRSSLSDVQLPVCIICDIDGTLVAPVMSRGNECDYTFIKPVADILARYYEPQPGENKIHLFLCTGRKDAARTPTEISLKEKGIQYDRLFMREGDDPAKDAIVKKEIYERHIKGKFNVLFVLDDRPSVCEMWVKQGLFVLNCNQDPMCRNPF